MKKLYPLLSVLFLISCEPRNDDIGGVRLSWLGFDVYGSIPDVVFYTDNVPDFPPSFNDLLDEGWGVTKHCDEIRFFETDGFLDGGLVHYRTNENPEVVDTLHIREWSHKDYITWEEL